MSQIGSLIKTIGKSKQKELMLLADKYTSYFRVIFDAFLEYNDNDAEYLRKIAPQIISCLS
jgi:hypothetical protein